MSRAQQNMIMESSVALGKLEVTPGSGAGGVSPNPRISGGSHGERSGPVRLSGPQGQTHLNGCVPLTHQVAGHKFGVDKVGILQHPDGTVLKQVQPPPRGPREMKFYSMVYAEDCCDPCLLDLQNHLPKYYGTWSSPDSPNDLYLKLEDVTRRFIRPCIMDVKLGQQSYDPFASEEKREQQIRKYPLMEEIGFLILGMRVYDIRSDTFESYDQHYGRGLDKDTVKDGLAKFFHNGVSLRKDAISASIRRVQRILHWFRSQSQLAFYASSLLFVYEGVPPSSSLRADPAVVPTATKMKVGREKEATENNNNIRVATPWDCTNHRKGGDDDDGVTQLMKSSDSELKPPAVGGEDNATWKQTAEPSREARGNRNKSERGEDGGRKNSSVRRGGEEEEEEGRGDGGAGDTEVEVRMIDFAHVFPSHRHDDGYVYGLKHLLTVLEQILCDAAHTPPPSS